MHQSYSSFTIPQFLLQPLRGPQPIVPVQAQRDACKHEGTYVRARSHSYRCRHRGMHPCMPLMTPSLM
eukprot:1138736-Pelagomonas_calceolata.AAC.3